MKALNTFIDGLISVLIGACSIALFGVGVYLLSVFAQAFPAVMGSIFLGITALLISGIIGFAITAD